VLCVSVKVKLTVPLLCVCVHSAWKGRPRNDLCCVEWDVKPYSLTHSLYSLTCYLFEQWPIQVQYITLPVTAVTTSTSRIPSPKPASFIAYGIATNAINIIHVVQQIELPVHGGRWKCETGICGTNAVKNAGGRKCKTGKCSTRNAGPENARKNKLGVTCVINVVTKIKHASKATTACKNT